MRVRYKNCNRAGPRQCQILRGINTGYGVQGTLHYDYAPQQLPGWSVAKSNERFGLVLYLQMPESGEAYISNHPWAQEDEQYNNDHLEKAPMGLQEVGLGEHAGASFCLLRVTWSF